MSKEWTELCKEHDAARDAVYEALGPVNQKFSTTGNPSHQELNELDEAWKGWENVKQKMQAFIKKHR